jgi:uncharacterized lipoprotein YmbA
MWMPGVLAVFLAVAGMAGCIGKSPRSSFYMLSPETADQLPTGSLSTAISVVGLGPIRMPDALDRSNIVTRTDANRLDISEYHRWAGNLGEILPRVMGENLAQILSPTPVVVYPWAGMAVPSHRVALDIIRFDGVRGDRIVLMANWSISGPNGSATPRIGRSRVEEPIASIGYDDYVAAQSRALATLSREIADALVAAF